MTSEKIGKEINNRVYNACMGLTYSTITIKIIKFTLIQAFYDGLLVFHPESGDPAMLQGYIHDCKINANFTND